MAEDYYATLGVEKTATADEILKAYRKMARKHHPDLNPNDKTAKEKFQKVQAAYDVLKDAEKRALYDQFGSDYDKVQAAGGPRGRAGGAPGGNWSWSTTGGDAGADINDLFGGRGPFADFFAQARAGRGGGGYEPEYSERESRRAEAVDTQQEITIPFRTAIEGGKVSLQVRRQSGKSERIEVTIKPGAEDGQKMRLRGQGEFGGGGLTPGDLILVLRIEPHKWFYRRGEDLFVRVPITLTEAVSGAKVDVPTPGGTVSLKVAPGTSSGAKLRIKGQGVKGGDLFAEILIKLPADLTDDERKQIEEIDQRHPQTPRQDLAW